MSDELPERLRGLPSYAPDDVGTAELLLSGALAPLHGYLSRADLSAVGDRATLADGTPWPSPVTLVAPPCVAAADSAVLTDAEGSPVALLRVSERWEETDGTHVAGPLEPLRAPEHGAFRSLRRTPAEVRSLPGAAAAVVWFLDAAPITAELAAAQTHGGRLLLMVREETLVSAALASATEIAGDGPRAAEPVVVYVPLPPPGVVDPERDLRLRAQIAATYGARALLSAPTPVEPPTACDHSIGPLVASDRPTEPPTVSATSTRQPTDGGHSQPRAAADRPESATATSESTPTGTGPARGEAPAAQPAAREVAVAGAAAGTATATAVPVRTLPDVTAERAQLQRLLAAGEPVPESLAPAAVVAALRRYRRAPAERGVVLFFTGLSGSGKSTVARRVGELLAETSRPTVSVLDGDVVRRLLSAGLSFSRADRDLNIARIGYVAAEIARHGGIAICAPIAPYAAVRAKVRAMVAAAGGDLVLVHVATPLAVCEARDRKGLYAKARAGEIAEFTGISDPYQPPEDAQLRIDTSQTDVETSARSVVDYLLERGYVARTNSTTPTPNSES